MGDRWHLILGDRHVWFGKNDTPARLMTVFREDDKYMHEEWAERMDAINARPADEVPTIDDLDDDLFESASRPELFGYKAPVRTVVARLDLMGFTADRCKGELQSWVDVLSDGEEGLRTYDKSTRQETYYALTSAQIVDLALRTLLPPESPLGLEVPEPPEPDKTCLDRVTDFFVDGEDLRILLGALLDGEDPDKILRLDLADLLSAGYFTSREEVSAQALEQLREETAATGPIIVITEGRFDSRVLARALQTVRPDVAGYFKFWDVDATKAPGGTDRVVANLRSFAAASVMNRVIGLVDNDAAGLHAEQQLAATPLPKSYRLCRLPDLDYAQSYPTVGPSGDAHDDVNGRACSIEFYFGISCLKGPDDQPIPVLWKSLNEKVRRWQGELKNKALVQRQIEAFLDAARPEDAQSDIAWEPMRQVADMLVRTAMQL